MNMLNVLISIAIGVSIVPGTLDAQIQHRPFTAVLRTTYYDEHGEALHFSSTDFRRSDGSFARINQTEEYEGERRWGRRIEDATTRTWITTEPFTETYLVFPNASDREFRAGSGVDENCRLLLRDENRLLGQKVIHGVDAVEVVQISGRSLARITAAPEFGCYRLSTQYFSDNKLSSVTEVISFTPGEPDPSAFEVPAGYREVSPAELEALFKQRFPGRAYFGPPVEAVQRQWEEMRSRKP